MGEKLQPFSRRKDELRVHDDCILWGHGVVIPLHVHDAHPVIQ